jgi:GAF domain-containing protein
LINTRVEGDGMLTVAVIDSKQGWDMGQHHGAESPLVFLGLRDTVFCTECELISRNHTSRCLACGSIAVLNLSRLMGGSLLGQNTARLITNEEIDSAVGEVVRCSDPYPDLELSDITIAGTGAPSEWQDAICRRSQIPLPALQTGVQRSCDLTGGTGAAVAISDGEAMVCRARAGTTAPEIGIEVPQDGLTALAIRSRRLWCCDDTEREPWANQEACRALGIRSMVIAPIVLPKRVLGVLEVFSPSPRAFGDYHSSAVQLIASALAVAVVRCGPHGPLYGELTS